MNVLRGRTLLGRLAMVGTVGALLVGVAACSSDDLGDRIAEGIAERAGGEDVDVDIDSESGRVDLSTPDGEFSLGGDELPDGFPDEVPLPSDLTVITSMRVGEGGTTAYTVVGQVDRSASAVVDEWTGAFGADGWEETMRSTSSFGDTDSTTAAYTKGGWTVSLFVSSGSEGGSDINLTVTDEP